MLRQHIYIPKYGWDVIVYYESDARDAAYILRELDEIGVDDENYFKAARNLDNGFLDTGLTYTNMDERVSVMVLSKTSSQAEFANTWVHEIDHCAKHIAIANDLKCTGEAPSYIAGGLAREMQPIAARLMCPTCKD